MHHSDGLSSDAETTNITIFRMMGPLFLALGMNEVWVAVLRGWSRGSVMRLTLLHTRLGFGICWVRCRKTILADFSEGLSVLDVFFQHVVNLFCCSLFTSCGCALD